jgi:hypothetical protein
LIERGLPFVFATGYGQRGVPEPYRNNPTLQKPFQIEALEQAIKAITPKNYGLLQPNSLASRVIVGSSVMSSLSGVTAMRCSNRARRDRCRAPPSPRGRT